MAKLVKKGTKGAVGEITPGPAEKPVAGIAEIDFGMTPASPSKRMVGKYPLLDGAGIEKLVDRIIRLSDDFDAVADPFKAAKQELVERGFPQYFEKNHGRVEVPSSMLAYGEKGGVRVTFKDQFTAGDKAKLYALLKPEVAALWFRQSWSIKIDGNAIPPEKAGALVTELKAVMAKHDASHALEIKSAILPKPDFATKRHAAFGPPMNLAINEIVPQWASVSTKGVKK